MTSRSIWFAAAFVLIGMAGSGARAVDAAKPWVDDLALFDQVQADVTAGGILALKPHLADLEKALAGGKQSADFAASQRPTSYVLTDGPTDTLGALTLAAGKMPAGATDVAAVANPYPMIAFYLASYYDETGSPGDALRVLDAGLTFGLLGDLGTGESRPMLMVERGAALMALRRWQDAVANEDQGLKLDYAEAPVKARLLRGRGYALTELDRLDEAENAYTESLKFEPDSERAKHELGYIAGLRAGKPRAAPGILNSVQPATTTPPASRP